MYYDTIMSETPPPPRRARAVREPVQVYLARDDSALLSRLVGDLGLSKAEILRRGVRALARERGGESPMLRFVAESADGAWPADVAGSHDEILAESYRGTRRRRR